jgi:acyl-CoA synthetase (AMP-forming)/AMP-acid ligase II
MQSNFVAHVRAQVATYGDARSYTYIRDNGGELVEEVLTYAQLDRHARSIATRLNQHEQASKPVLLLYSDAIDFLPAFLGCLYGGVVAVPAPFPHDARSMRRVVGMLDEADIGLVLTTSASRDQVRSWMRETGTPRRICCLATDPYPLGDPDTWRMPDLDRDTVAFLQYTSGSTSQHNGVMVTHGNLMHNTGVIADVLQANGPISTGVGWLPHFHDMGLIGMLLEAIFTGGNLVFMSPLAFLKRPRRWLEMIDRYRAEVTVAPNFAYDLIARHVTDAQLQGLDLSSLRVAMNGAEPIRASTLDRVTERLAPYGFRPDVFLPCYGMAEVTLCATASRAGAPYVHRDVDAAALERNEVVAAGTDGGVRLVGSGRLSDVDLRIVHPHSHDVLPENQVGEIWLRGQSVAAGYWNRPQETRETFQASTSSGDGPFLGTGDLGFLSGGELFVTGRLKDLLIVNGRNLYPQDIEEIVRDVHPAVAQTAGVAFPIDNGREHVVLIQGIQSARLNGLDPAELAAPIKLAVARAFEIPAPSVVLVQRSGVHLTTSGKVQRQSMRAAFLENRLEALVHEDVDPTINQLRAGTSPTPQSPRRTALCEA